MLCEAEGLTHSYRAREICEGPSMNISMDYGPDFSFAFCLSVPLFSCSVPRCFYCTHLRWRCGSPFSVGERKSVHRHRNVWS
jgi:hypothetical protein